MIEGEGDAEGREFSGECSCSLWRSFVLCELLGVLVRSCVVWWGSGVWVCELRVRGESSGGVGRGAGGGRGGEGRAGQRGAGEAGEHAQDPAAGDVDGGEHEGGHQGGEEGDVVDREDRGEVRDPGVVDPGLADGEDVVEEEGPADGAVEGGGGIDGGLVPGHAAQRARDHVLHAAAEGGGHLPGPRDAVPERRAREELDGLVPQAAPDGDDRSGPLAEGQEEDRYAEGESTAR
jgi:hypothetical protein